MGPYGFYRNGGPHWGSVRLIAPVRDGLVHFPPDFVVPVRPMIGFVSLQEAAPHRGALDGGGNMDFNAVQPGSILHIRAQKPGALLYICDVHARMGDGELTGTGVEIDAATRQQLQLSSTDGALVVAVTPGSAAEKAGIRAGDVITKAGDTAVHSPDDLSDALSEAKPGDHMAIQVERGGNQLTLDATLGQRAN